MKKKLCLLFICLILSACVNEGENSAEGNSTAEKVIGDTPEFLWPAFDRFWSRGPGVGGSFGDGPFKLPKNPMKDASGYTVHFGSGIRLHIPITAEGYIQGADAYYIAKQQYYHGGPIFMDLIQHMITVGAFRWKPEIIQQFNEFLGGMTAEKKEFRHKGIIYTREKQGETWIFRMRFMPFSEEIWMRPKEEEI